MSNLIKDDAKRMLNTARRAFLRGTATLGALTVLTRSGDAATPDGKLQTSYLDVPGARLYFETRGSGPLMLLIPGANGDANAFPPFANLLANEFTVVTYDRRGYTRSMLDGAQDY